MSFFGLFGSKKKKHTEEQHAAAPAAAPAPQAAPPGVPPGVPQDVMAAISAAVYVAMYGNEGAAAKVEIKHPSLLWAQTGRLDLMNKNQSCF